MYDPELGFDPTEAFCVRGCGRQAPYSDTYGITEDGDELSELHCGDEGCS